MDATQPDDLAAGFGLTVTAHHDPDWALQRSAWTAEASGAGVLPGHGSGPDRAFAATIAVMESVERASQFGQTHTPVVTVDSAAALGSAAVHVPSLGLYAEEQYRRWGSDLARYSENAPVAWVAGTRLRDSREILVPLEAIHPRAPTPGPPLVFETSSGTAAGTTQGGATASALCEAVERDACLRWWYTRTPTVGVELSASTTTAEDLERVAALGFVVVVRRLSAKAALPVVMAAALRGHQAVLGVGCAPRIAEAMSHALRELSTRLRWVLAYPDRRVLHLPLSAVRTGADHVALYDRGPLHSQLRVALDETTTEHVEEVEADPPSTGQPCLEETSSVLLDVGLDPIAVALPVSPPVVGVHVQRVLVPGLVPFWTGADRERLSIDLLGGHRVRSLLPHPFG